MIEGQMFPTQRHSLEEFNIEEIRKGNLDLGGVWSVLITPSANLAADFANRYLDTFDRIVQGDWHLAVGVEPDASGRRQWRGNANFQTSINDLRARLEARGQQIPDFGVMFFDPHGDAIEHDCVFIPLDGTKIGNAHLYEKGFILTHQAIRETFAACDLNPDVRVAPDKINVLLATLDQRLRRSIFRIHLRNVGIAVGNALLGAAMGAPF